MITLKFTFQSGDIQMLLIVLIVADYITFTFQSGDIQIFDGVILQNIQKNLHSNLVIFKLIKICQE